MQKIVTSLSSSCNSTQICSTSSPIRTVKDTPVREGGGTHILVCTQQCRVKNLAHWQLFIPQLTWTLITQLTILYIPMGTYFLSNSPCSTNRKFICICSQKVVICESKTPWVLKKCKANQKQQSKWLVDVATRFDIKLRPRNLVSCVNSFLNTSLLNVALLKDTIKISSNVIM